MSLDRRLRRALSSIILAVGLLVAAALPGWAHAVQISVFPADASEVPQVPNAVVVTFNEEPQQLGTQAAAQGPEGPVETTLTISGNTVEIGLPAGSPPGRYSVQWRVTSVDGHPIQGSTTFNARHPSGGGAPVASPTRTPVPTDIPETQNPAAAAVPTAEAAPDAEARPPSEGESLPADGTQQAPEPAGQSGSAPVAVSDATFTNGADDVNSGTAPADTTDSETDGLSGTTLLLIGLTVALAGGALAWLAVRGRRG